MLLPQLTGTSYRILVIGAGPQGSAAALTLLEAGHEVLLFDAAAGPCGGIAWRPDTNLYGTKHGGGLFAEWERAQLCFELDRALRNPSTKALEIYREKLKKTGKLIVARRPEALETLRLFEKRLVDGGVDHHFLTEASELADLKEPSLGNVQGVIELPGSGIVPIREYVGAMHKEIGRNLHFGHKVTGFEAASPETAENGIGVMYDDGKGEKKLYVDAVVNMAGAGSIGLAHLAGEALRAHTHIVPAALPEIETHIMGVLVPKDPAFSPLRRRLFYFADNAILTGPKSTLGLHSYLGNHVGDNLYTITIGATVYHGNSLEELAQRILPSKDLTDRQKIQANHVVPGINFDQWEHVYLGGSPVCLVNGERSLPRIPYDDPATGFYVLNCLTFDTPGMTVSALLGLKVAEEVLQWLMKNRGPSPARKMKLPAELMALRT